MVFANERLREQARSTKPSRVAPSRFAFNPSDVATSLRAHIRGQDEVINRLEDQLNVIASGLYDERRPLLSALFIGATGTGKTETVRQLAKAIHGRTDAFCRIDMNTLSQAHYSAAITGAPPGYVGSKENLSLFDDDLLCGTSTRPGIVLFDEIEKADTSVVRALMNVLDNGVLKLASGQKSLSFHNTLVFMTRNVGSRQADRLGWLEQLPGMNRPAVYKRALLRHFDTEFINRIGIVEYFSALPSTALPGLVEQLESGLNERLKKQQLSIAMDSHARLFIAQHADTKRYGARALERAFRDHVITGVARFIQTATTATTHLCLKISANHQSLIFRPEYSADDAEHTLTTPTSLSATQGENHD